MKYKTQLQDSCNWESCKCEVLNVQSHVLFLIKRLPAKSCHLNTNPHNFHTHFATGSSWIKQTKAAWCERDFCVSYVSCNSLDNFWFFFKHFYVTSQLENIVLIWDMIKSYYDIYSLNSEIQSHTVIACDCKVTQLPEKKFFYCEMEMGSEVREQATLYRTSPGYEGFPKVNTFPGYCFHIPVVLREGHFYYWSKHDFWNTIWKETMAGITTARH